MTDHKLSGFSNKNKRRSSFLVTLLVMMYLCGEERERERERERDKKKVEEVKIQTRFLNSNYTRNKLSNGVALIFLEYAKKFSAMAG